MTIRHHLSDPILLSYSAGELPEAFSLVVATHLSMCDECRARAGAFDAIGGNVIEHCMAEMADSAMDAAMARITGLPVGAKPAIAPRGDAGLPGPLVDYIGGGLESVKWRSLGMGVRHAVLPTEKGATARLLYIPAGQAMPDHGHGGTELTLVLRGAFMDGDARFAAGDLEIADESTNHTPVADAGDDCICLVAADAKLRFSGLIPRLAQPFFRI